MNAVPVPQCRRDVNGHDGDGAPGMVRGRARNGKSGGRVPRFPDELAGLPVAGDDVVTLIASGGNPAEFPRVSGCS